MISKSRVKLHDGIVGAVVLASVVLALKVNAQWIYLAGAIGVLMIISAFSGFCPVYFLLNKLMPEKK